MIHSGSSLWLAVLLGASAAPAAPPLLRWSFEDAAALPGELRGFHAFVPGVTGRGLQFDGFTTSIRTGPALLERLDARKGFTLRAWVALGAYPWNRSPVLEHGTFGQTGFSFGIDANGRFGLGMQLGEQWVLCRSEIPPPRQSATGPKVDLELRRWHDLVAVFAPGEAITLYRDGRLVNSLPLEKEGNLTWPATNAVVVGRMATALPAAYPVRAWATFASPDPLDGTLDELEVYDRPLSAAEVAAAHAAVKVENAPPAESRDWPAPVAKGGPKFGAFPMTLKYYPQWDRLWETKVTEHADVAVTFDDLPIRMVFWRGTRYSPCWVSENNKWMADQSREVGGNWNAPRPAQDEPTGCIEHMQDTQCRSARAQIIEHTPARVVVEWVYAQMDALLRYQPDDTGWPLWGRERYTVYPDGVAVRHVLPGEGGWQETIFLNAAGTRPEDNVEAAALTLVTLEGKSETYSWAAGYPAFDRTDAPIEVINFKSRFKPFIIFQPGSRISCFNAERRPEYSLFPWWNHWPVALIASDGRHCQAEDRAAHSSLAWGDPLGDCALYGMTDQRPESLVTLAKSWSNPAKLTVAAPVTGAYVPQQRAYELDVPAAGSVGIHLAATPESPVHNPAFVLKNWGDRAAAISVNGQTVMPGKALRVGQRARLEGTDLLVWLRLSETNLATVTVRFE
jgi:hypothetical protein